MISVSEKAAQRISDILKDKGSEDLSIRVSVLSGGCSGLSYNLDFDSENQEGDQVCEDRGITIRVDKKSFFYLIGTELDYSDGLQGKGFAFKNPNASRTCACGESFSL